MNKKQRCKANALDYFRHQTILLPKKIKAQRMNLFPLKVSVEVKRCFRESK